MSAPQIIKTGGEEEFVVLSRRDYDALLARAGDEAAEDAMTRRIVAETSAGIAAGDDVAIPQSLWDELEATDGEPMLRQVRRWRSLTQAQLAHATGLQQGYVSDLEAGRKTGSPDTLKALARALRVPLELIAGR